MSAISRKQKAIIALHDFGSREGATAAKVKKQMKDAGFTTQEIAEAAAQMDGSK